MSDMNHPIALLVEDDESFRESLSLLVSREGFEVLEAAGLTEARERLSRGSVDVVLADLGLPDGDGLDLLRDEEFATAAEFIVITGNATVNSAVAALREGVLDYLVKPIDRARLKSVLTNVVRTRELKSQVASLRGELRELGRFGKLVGRSEPMQKVYDLIAKVAPTQASVFVTGESGTGKELVAETIHLLSKRKSNPFLAVNCGAVSNTVIESELFGHEKGSFTGADRRRQGYFEEANGGTLFLDEITEMPPELQVKLLRVLENGTLLRVGASEPVSVDVRVIAATNRDPEKAVKDGKLREDLYYRLHVFPIALPPLHSRGEDVNLLADHFLAEVNAREETNKKLTPAARKKLNGYSWPGNVRELKNLIERAAILADESIGVDLLPGPGDGPLPENSGSTLQVSVGSTLDDVERRLLLATLEEVGGDKKRAAEILGISVKTVYNRLNLYEASGHTLERKTVP